MPDVVRLTLSIEEAELLHDLVDIALSDELHGLHNDERAKGAEVRDTVGAALQRAKARRRKRGADGQGRAQAQA